MEYGLTGYRPCAQNSTQKLSIMHDYLTDSHYLGASLLAEDNLLPDYARNWDIPQEKLASVHDVWFASREGSHRTLPMFDKCSAFHSELYLLLRGGENVDPSIANPVLTAAQNFGVQEDVEQAYGALRTLQMKAASARQEVAAEIDPEAIPYAYTLSPAGDEPTHYYPLDNPQNIMKAAQEVLADNSAQVLPAPLFRSACINIVREATRHKMASELPSGVHHQGTLLIPNPAHAEHSLHSRQNLVVTLGKDWNEWGPVYEGYVKAASADPSLTEEAANAWCAMDEELGLLPPYNKAATNPYVAFFREADPVTHYGLPPVHIKLAGIDIPVEDFVKHASVCVPEAVFVQSRANLVRKAAAAAGANQTATAQNQLSLLSDAEQRDLLELLATTEV